MLKIKSLLIDKVEKINVKRMDFHMKLSFRENKRDDLSDSGILRKEKKNGDESKISFPINDAESKTLQKNQLKTMKIKIKQKN